MKMSNCQPRMKGNAITTVGDKTSTTRIIWEIRNQTTARTKGAKQWEEKTTWTRKEIEKLKQEAKQQHEVSNEINSRPEIELRQKHQD